MLCDFCEEYVETVGSERTGHCFGCDFVNEDNTSETDEGEF